MCFKDIPGYSGRYQVNDKGKVRSVGADCIVRNIKRRNGVRKNEEIWHRKTKFLRPIYNPLKPYVHLYDKESRRKNFYIAQLVLMCFVTDGKLIPIRQIKYKDENPQNCCIDNLYF